MLHDITLGTWEFSASFRVGRSRRCELSILTSEETRTVSKNHVNFIPYTETLATTYAGHGMRRWIVYDLDTTNGTAINGEDIATGGNREVHDGDEVVLASAIRQCVRLLIQFKDESHTHIVIKVLTRSVAASSVPLRHPSATPEALPGRSLRQAVETYTSATTGFGRSAMIDAASPMLTRTGCRGTPGRDANIVTPPPQTLSQKRNRPSLGKITDTAEKKKRQETPSSQQRTKRSRRGEESEKVVAATETDASTAAKSPQEREKVDRERLMMCPVCLEYFHCSATLPCSHTFCGYCISNWFRSSLSCPECRDVVKNVPVRNRALDELVEQLVGHTEAYKSHVRRRAWMQQRSIQSRRYQQYGSDRRDENMCEGATTRDVSSPNFVAFGLRSKIFTRWSFEEKLAFSAYISEQFGETRVATCKKVGLTETAIDCLNLTELIIATQNLLLDCGSIGMISDECRQRLKIFLFFG